MTVIALMMASDFPVQRSQSATRAIVRAIVQALIHLDDGYLVGLFD